jgi:hypothetical protein
MERAPCPRHAFREIAPVLRPGGQALMTFPFSNLTAANPSSAELVGGSIVHRLDPVYHGTPLSAEGSLVFTGFGWDYASDFGTLRSRSKFGAGRPFGTNSAN